MKENDSELQVKFSPSQKMNLCDLLQNVLKDPFQVEVYYIDKLCKKEETVYFTLCWMFSKPWFDSHKKLNLGGYRLSMQEAESKSPLSSWDRLDIPCNICWKDNDEYSQENEYYIISSFLISNKNQQSPKFSHTKKHNTADNFYHIYF
jgi:hypothetical protein